MRRWFFCLLVGLLTLSFMPESAIANMASPWYSGDPVAEPVGVFRQLDILQEKLLFDLRSLGSQPQGQVTATYQIRNQGKAVTIDLVFLSPGIKTGNVSLDNNKISSQIVPKPSLPKAWDDMMKIPTIGETSNWDGNERISVYNTAESVLKFQTTLPSGEHSLQVSYEVKPGTYNGRDIYREYNIGYLLAPARSWASFGKLDIEVNLPAGWEVVTAPLKLQRNGDILKGSFTGIPADSLAIATRPNVWGFSLVISILVEIIGWMTGLLVWIVCGQKIAQIKHREGANEWMIFISAFFLLMLPGGLIIPIIGSIGEYLSLVILDNGHFSHLWAYGQNILRFLLFPLIGFGLGILLMPFAFVYWRYYNNCP